jgi:hypothetical protein
MTKVSLEYQTKLESFTRDETDEGGLKLHVSTGILEPIKGKLTT